MTYSKKLASPKWQRKRLEILNRDNFTCQSCGSDKYELHVHHFKYSNTGKPEDVNDEDLITYCSHCHLITEITKKFSEYKIIEIRTENADSGLITALGYDLEKDDKFLLVYNLNEEYWFVFHLKNINNVKSKLDSLDINFLKK